MNFFSLGKNRSHLEPRQGLWSQVSSSTGCHPKFRLWTTPSPTIFAIRVRTARQMAGWKTRNNYFSTMVSERWRNAGSSAFQLQVSMLTSDKIWCAYLVVNCVRLRTFWTPLVVLTLSICFTFFAQKKVKIMDGRSNTPRIFSIDVLQKIPQFCGCKTPLGVRPLE